LILAGAVVCLANPYFTGWWATIGVGQMAHLEPRTMGEYGAFFLGHELADYTWYFAVGLLVIGAREVLHGAWYNWLIGSCGVAIVVVALLFVITGYKLVAVASAPEIPATAAREE
jgi:threonine/homoserine/homoserine lactone efflux protein